MNVIRFLFALAFCIVAQAASAAPTTQDFDGPGTSYHLVTDTGTPPVLQSDVPGNNYLRLVSNTLSSNGNVFFDQTESLPLRRVVAEFDFRMFGGQFGSHADGIGFLLLNTNEWGTSGPVEISHGEDTGVEPWREAKARNSIGVGFDIYHNPTTPESNGNHVSIHFNRQLLANFDPGFSLHDDVDSGFHHATIAVEFVDAGALLTMMLTSNTGLVTTPFEDYLIPDVAPYRGRIALGGNSGVTSAFHDIDNVVATFTPVPEPSTVVSAVLLGSAFQLIRRRRNSLLAG